MKEELIKVLEMAKSIKSLSGSFYLHPYVGADRMEKSEVENILKNIGAEYEYKATPSPAFLIDCNENAFFDLTIFCA